MEPAHLAKVFAQSMLLGALIGLQRQRKKRPIAGIRTLPMVAALGTLCALLSEQFSAWVLAAGMLSVGAVVVSSRLLRWQVKHTLGTTSEIAMLVTFALGAALVHGPALVVIALGVVTAALLQYKPELHGLVQRLESKDVYAVVQFTLIAFVVLPVLPDRSYLPFDVLNPRQIWWMVLLVSGMSLVSYAALKLLGGRKGTLASGLIGGLVSSTATTLTLSRRSQQGNSAPLASAAIMAASGVVFLRIGVIVALVDRALLPDVIVPMVGLFLVGLGVSAVMAWRGSGDEVPLPEVHNPCELRFSLLFALLYAVVLFLLAAGRHYLGDRGVYAVSALSGLTDMDAIAVSVSRLCGVGEMTPRVAVRAIIAASMANMIFKCALVGILGDRSLLKRTALGFAVLFAAGAAAIALV